MVAVAAMFTPLALAETVADPASTNDLNSARIMKFGVGSWIWTSETHDQQTCRFWRKIEIERDATVARALLRITGDNAYHLFFDGREIGQGAEWKSLTEYDLTLLVTPGTHVLAVEVFNEYAQAGLVAGLHLEFQDGRTIEIPTDRTWKIVTTIDRHWTTKQTPDPNWLPATVEAPYNGGIWNISKPSRIVLMPPIQPITLKFWQSGWFHILVLIICTLLAITCIHLTSKLAIHTRARQIVQQERARIARDIHDDLTASLTQLVLYGEVAKSGLVEGSGPEVQVARLCEKARSVSSAMNEIIWVVNSQRDTFRDFASYVCKYAETFLQPTAVRCRFDVDEEMPDLACDLGVRRNLFLGVKEALNNAVRHSGATELTLRIHRQGDNIVVSVEDNGRGFDPETADQARNGLRNMMQRAVEAGGICHISSRPGLGCRVEFITPLTRSVKFYSKLWKIRSPTKSEMISALGPKPLA